MVTRLRSVFLAAALVLVGAAAFSWFNPAAVLPPPVGPRVHFQPGQRWAYELDWAAKTSGQLAGAQDASSVGLETHLTGELLLEVVTPHPEGALLAVSLSRIDRFDFAMQGQAAEPELEAVRTALVAHPAFVELDGRGRVRGLAFDPSASAPLRATLRAVVLELGFTLPQQANAEWDADEPNTLGTLSAHYVGSATDFVRTPGRYLTLDAVPGVLTGTEALSGKATLCLDADGTLRSLEDVQHVHYRRPGQAADALDSSWTFLLHRTPGIPAGAQATAPALLTPEPLQGTVGDEGLVARRDARQARDMNPELLALTIHRFEHGTRPGHTFLVSAGAYLRLHPEALPELLLQFSSVDLTLKGRGLMLDVMAEAGDARAQAAMREALGAPAAHTKGDYSQLAQRFSFVRRPTAESIDFLAQEARRSREAGDLEGAQGPVVALGSSVRRLQERGDLERAHAANAQLRAELDVAKTGTSLQKRGVLAALGNAARPENLEAILGFAHDPDSLVRDQVASALRSVDSPLAREALLTLAAEGTTAVTTSALDALRRQTLTTQDWDALARLAREGTTPASSDGTLLALVREHRAEAGPAGREILQALLQRNQGGDNDLAQIIEALLAQG